jgi:hypothetical protein
MLLPSPFLVPSLFPSLCLIFTARPPTICDMQRDPTILQAFQSDFDPYASTRFAAQPTPKNVLRIFYILAVILALTAGYFATVAENQQLTLKAVNTHLGTKNTIEIMQFQWQKKMEQP